MGDDLKRTGIELVADGAPAFTRAVEDANSAMASMGSSAQGAGSGIDVLGEIATGALRRIGELAIDGVGLLATKMVDFVKDAMEGEKLLARLTSVITATGGAAGLTVSQAQDLATQFKDLAGGSDEAVLAIEEMALRMGTVSADQMPGFIQTTLDLAAATGTDATNAARLLAQAYDDPASAMTRFGKMGIRFDAQLQDQIKSLMKAGKTSEAFALMMGRVGEATAGAAAGQANTLAGQIGIMQEHLADAGKAIGEAFLPLLKTLFENVIKPGIPIVENIAGVIADLVNTLVSGGDIGAWFDGFRDVLIGIGEFFGIPTQSMLDFVNGPLVILYNAFDNLRQSFAMFPDDPLGAVTNSLYNLGYELETQLGLLGANNLFSLIGDSLLNLNTLWTTNWPIFQATLQGVVDAVWAVVQAKLMPAINNISEVFMKMLPIVQGVIQDLVSFVQTTWANMSPTLLANITNTLTSIVSIVSTYLNAVAKFWNEHGAMIMAVIDFVMKVVIATVGGALTLVSGIISTVLQIIDGNWSGAWNTILTTLGTFFQLALNVVGVNLADFLGQWNFIMASVATLVQMTLTNMLAAVMLWFINFIKTWQDNFAAFLLIVTTLIDKVKFAWNNIDWPAIGKNVIEGIKAGIMNAAASLAQAAANAASAALQAAKDALGIQSPSTMFAEIGRQSMAGMALGIENAAAVPSRAASQAATSVAQTTSNTINNYWQYSPAYGGAPAQPSADFALMQVMAA